VSSIGFHKRAVLATLAAALLASAAAPAIAAPSATQAAESRQRVEATAQRLAAAQERAGQARERLAQTSAQLDDIVADQRAAQVRLTSRARAMYRSGDVSFVSVLLSAETFEDFASRWQLLARMNLHDAQTVKRLEGSRKRARATAEELMRLQAESVRSAETIERELARARRDLAADEAALALARSRASKRSVATNPRPAASPKRPAARKQPSGRGSWKTAVASHYGINFEGRGASGEKIGPYSMIVAHKTLPFGTLIEFEYGGKRAVAKVADRGPHVAGREFDLGPGVARALDFSGVHEVRYRVIGR
jgi:rare lipoprotein A (peptidoglycan hydrolase)